MTAKIPPRTITRDLYDLLTGDEDARVCRDIPEDACREQPRNFFLHLAALTATKSGDLLASAKLVLPWLLAALGAPAYLTGMLVPVRESLALLPQLLVAGVMRRAPVRKWFWVGGSVVQGLCLLGIVGVGLAGIAGASGGILVLGLLAVFSLGRGVCSVASKDVMGKTVSKTRRGTVSGYAASAAGAVAAGLGIYLLLGHAPSEPAVLAMLGGAAGLWLLAALIYAAISEQPGATAGGGNAAAHALRNLRLLREDADLRAFIVTRALLMSSALAAPFYVLLARHHTGGALSVLALMLLASGMAGAGSGVIWGRLADRSSRQVLIAAGLLTALAGIATVCLTWLDTGTQTATALYAGCFLLLGVAHSGVRLGRKTYLVDLAGADNRAGYVALSNTLIGALLLTMGALTALLAHYIGNAGILLVLAAAALAGTGSAWRLAETEND